MACYLTRGKDFRVPWSIFPKCYRQPAQGEPPINIFALTENIPAAHLFLLLQSFWDAIRGTLFTEKSSPNRVPAPPASVEHFS